MSDKNFKLGLNVQAEGSLDEEIKKLERLRDLKNEINKKVELVPDSAIKELTDLLAVTEETTTAYKKQKAVVDDMTKAELKLAVSQTDHAKKLAEVNFQIQQQNKANKQAAKELLEKRNAYGELNKTLEDNKKKVKDLLASGNELSKSDKQLIKDTQDLDAKIKGIDRTVGEHQRNVGNYRDALNNLPGAFGSAARGADALGTQLLKLLKNPIVLIIAGITAALYGLFKAFTSTDSGGTKFAAVMEQVSAVIDVVRQRASDLASGIVNIFTGDWKQASEDFKAAFTGVSDQLKNATAAAREYIFALDELEDAEISYISERAKSANKIAKLEFFSQDKRNSIEARRDALREAIRLSEVEAQKEAGFAQRRFDLKIKEKAAILNIDKEELKRFIESNDERAEKQLEFNDKLAAARDKLGDEGQKELEELFAKQQDADKKSFEENKRNISRLSGFEETIAKDKEEVDKKIKDEEKKRRDEANKKAEEAENKRVAAFIKNSERQVELVKEETERLLAAEDLKYEKELNAAKKNGEDIELIQLIHQQNILKIKQDAAKREEEEAKKLFDKREKLADLETQRQLDRQAENKKAIEEAEKEKIKQIEQADKIEKLFDKALDKESNKKLDRLNKEQSAEEKNLALQESRAEKGLKNTLEFEQQKTAKLQIEKEKQAKKDRIRQEITAFWDLFSAFAKEPGTSPQEAFKKTAIEMAEAKAFTLLFAEKGGIIGDITDRTTLSSGNLSKRHSSGDRFVVASPNEGMLNERQMANLGGREGFYNLQTMLNKPINDDIMFPAVPVFAAIPVQNNNRELLREIQDLKQIIKDKPVSSANIDKAGDVIKTTVEQGVKHVLKVKSQKPSFRR
jgi:hypothetical protein